MPTRDPAPRLFLCISRRPARQHARHGFSDVVTLLRKEQCAASNIKSRVNRQSVTSTLRSLIAYLTKQVKNIPENGLCLFWGPDTSQRHAIEPPLPLDKNDYICGRKFYLDPLSQLQVDAACSISTAIVVVNGESAVVGGFRGTAQKPTVLLDWSTGVSFKKHKKGGQSAQRFGRLADEQRQRYYGIVSDKINAVLRQKNIKNVLLTGAGETKYKLEIQGRILATETIAHSGMAGLYEARPLLAAVDQQYAQENDQALYDAFLSALDESCVAIGAAEIAEQMALKNVEYRIEMSGRTALSTRFARDYGECAVLYVNSFTPCSSSR